jgi:hypothetical protein
MLPATSEISHRGRQRLRSATGEGTFQHGRPTVLRHQAAAEVAVAETVLPVTPHPLNRLALVAVPWLLRMVHRAGTQVSQIAKKTPLKRPHFLESRARLPSRWQQPHPRRR